MSEQTPFPDDLVHRFGSITNTEPTVYAMAPGRINIIGEHVDYTGGYVLPCAIDYTFNITGRPLNGKTVRLHSADFDQDYACSLEDIHKVDRPAWANYALGSIVMLQRAGIEVPGFEAALSSTVPIGAGLSSSAAFEVATARFVLAMTGQEMDPMELAKLARRAENEFVGVPCGLMDQFISVFGQADSAVLLNCRTLEHRAVPLELGEYTLVLSDTMVKHELGSTEYAHRQDECATGLTVARRALSRDIEDLGQLTPDDFDTVHDHLEPVVLRRVRHVVTENRRVLDAVEALQTGDLETLGRLLLASHASLRDDYEVSCPELDYMVTAAMNHPGTLGARMVGGGFGGCVLTLIARSEVDSFTSYLKRAYRDQTGRETTLIEVEPATGARAWTTG